MSSGTAGGVLSLLTPARPDLRRSDADLIVLAALLVLTAAGGRAFSRIGVGDTLFVSEVALLAAIVLVLVRLGLQGAWGELRARVPLVALAVFWIMGAIAAVRGLREFGLSLVTEDIGLVEYSVLVPLVALVITDRRRLVLLGQALLVGSIACIAIFAIHQIALHAGRGGGPIGLMGSASGMYISFFVAWIGARAVAGLAVRHWELAVASVGLLLMWFTDQRSVWLAILLIAVALVTLAPGARRRLALAGVGGSVAAGFALYIALAAIFVVPAGTGVQPIEEIVGVGGAASEEGANVRWRLAYWSELAERTATDPTTAAIGVGFGQPAAFVWEGMKYDFRDGDPAAQMDVGGPHNSFVAIMYRMGVPALLAVLALVAITAWRALPLLREGRLPAGRRVELIAIVCALLATSAVAAFNEALKGPFLGMFFWVALSLLLIYPVIERCTASECTNSVAAS